MNKFIEHQRKQFKKLGWKYVVVWLVLPAGLIFAGIRYGYRYFHLHISNEINNKLKRTDKKLTRWIRDFTDTGE